VVASDRLRLSDLLTLTDTSRRSGSRALRSRSAVQSNDLGDELRVAEYTVRVLWPGLTA